MRWIVDHGEYERQHDDLLRRTNTERLPDLGPEPSWERDPTDQSRDWEPEALPRPADLLRGIMRLRRHR